MWHNSSILEDNNCECFSDLVGEAVTDVYHLRPRYMENTGKLQEIMKFMMNSAL